MRLIDRVFGRGDVPEMRNSFTTGIGFDQFAEWLAYNNNQYPVLGMSQTWTSEPVEEISSTLTSISSQAYAANGPVFALEAVRMLIFSDARLAFRRLRSGRPGGLFTNEALARFQRPWPGGTTGDLLRRMILHADLSGNWFGVLDGPDIVTLRPDWVTIITGQRDSRLGNELVGYTYKPGGPASSETPKFLYPDEVAHFAPYPDPLADFRGMSWLTPVIREIQSDVAATVHKQKFYENAATPNLAITLDKAVTPQQFVEFQELFSEQYEGNLNAYKTLMLGGGADVTVVGADMKQLDFKVTQGAGETRLASAARIHPVVAYFSEGMQGSSLNAGNFSSARRATADTCFRPLWRDAVGSLANIANVPSDAELWYDDRDIAFLRDDGKQEAEIFATKMSAIRTGVDGGFNPASVVAAADAEDLTLLEHTGKVSVQLLPDGDLDSSNGGDTETDNG